MRRFQEVRFMPQAHAVQLTPMADTALISITGPASEAQLKYGWNHLLRLEFHDADIEEFDGCLLFDQDMARQVIQFVESLPDTVTRVYVHCHAGISRSAGVAKFVAEMTDSPFNKEYNSYNRLVYSTLRKAYFGDQYGQGLGAFEALSESSLSEMANDVEMAIRQVPKPR